MLNKETSQALKKLIAEQDFICLSTINLAGMPETRAMINLANPKLFPNIQSYFTYETLIAYFSTHTFSDKMQHIAKQSNSSLYYYNEKTIEGLILFGKLSIVTNKKTKKDFWQDSWTMYYPEGVDDATYTLLKFTPKSYKYYNGKGEHFSGPLA